MGLCRSWLTSYDMGQDGRLAELLQVLRNPKKLLAAVVKSFADNGGNGERWGWRETSVITNPGGAIFKMWRLWQRTGQLPKSGGWLDQPLEILVQFEALEMVYQTMRYKTAEGSKWENLTALQLDIVRELDG